MELYIVRHGIAKSNLKETARYVPNPAYESLTDIDDSLLTPKGEVQANLTGMRLAKVNFDAVLTSPILRAVQTAAGIVRHQQEDKTIEILYDLAECMNYEYPLVSPERFAPLWKDVKIADGNPDYGGKLPYETEEESFDRALRVSEYVRSRFKGDEKVLLVSHGGFMCAYLLLALTDIPREKRNIYRLHADHCGITKIKYTEDGMISVICIDSTYHLKNVVEDTKFR